MEQNYSATEVDSAVDRISAPLDVSLTSLPQNLGETMLRAKKTEEGGGDSGVESGSSSWDRSQELGNGPGWSNNGDMANDWKRNPIALETESEWTNGERDAQPAEENHWSSGEQSGDERRWQNNSPGWESGGEEGPGWDREVRNRSLEEELNRAHEQLRLRDQEVTRLTAIRKDVEAELEELTASLFQEAHKMVGEANMREACAERRLKEKSMQVEVLSAEVAALKTLLLTSTPSRPNPHLHPQLENTESSSGFFRKHRRSPSHFNLKYGRENSPPGSPTKAETKQLPTEIAGNNEALEVDPVVHKEFLTWRQTPSIDKSIPFIARLYKEDINYCLEFNNKELADKVRAAVESGDIFIEAVSDKTKNNFPKKCALLETVRQCHYRFRVGNCKDWYSISQICRNRIIAVCDLLNYLRYIERGLVKSSEHDIYWEIVKLRKEVVLARLGLALSS